MEPHDSAHPKKTAMLTALALTGNVTAAAKKAKVGRRTHYEWVEQDPEYKAAVADAMEEAADLMEEEARRRGADGVLEPVFHQGKRCGTIRKYSDTLLIFLLKGARPEKYRERSTVDMNHQGTIHHTLSEQADRIYGPSSGSGSGE